MVYMGTVFYAAEQRAGELLSDGIFNFRWGKEELLMDEDEAFGTMTLEAPKLAYISSVNNPNAEYNEGSYYGDPEDATLFLRNWDPRVRYTIAEGKGRDGAIGNVATVRHHGFSDYSSYGQTYYLMNEAEGYGYEELWKEFLAYVREQIQDSGEAEFWKLFQLHLFDAEAEPEDSTLPFEPFFYAISQRQNGGAQTLTDANEIARRMDSYLTKFMKEKKAATVYNKDRGIDFKSMAESDRVNVVVVRTGIANIQMDYIKNDEAGILWTEQYIPTVMLSTGNYPVNFKEPLQVPAVEGFSTKEIISAPETDESDETEPVVENDVFRDEAVRLDFDGNDDAPNKELEYALFARDYTIDEVEKMNSFATISEDYIKLWGTGLSGNYRYLYVRTTIDGENAKYRNSKIVKYRFKLEKATVTGGIETTIESEIETDTDAVDVGDSVHINVPDNPDAAVFYTLDDTIPEFELYMRTREDPQNPELIRTVAELEAEIGLEDNTIFFLKKFSDYNYIKVNDFWYRCAKSVQQYTDPIAVNSDIRQRNRLLLRARIVQSGLELGEMFSTSIPYRLKQRVATPRTDIPTSEDAPTVIKMGTKMNFISPTVGSEIFYTTNGSVPVVKTEKNKNGNYVTKPGNEATIKYVPSKVMTITEEIAAYGSTLTFVVMAVNYDGEYRKMSDSEVVKFPYIMEAQAVVEPIAALPATDAENPVIVSPGDKIMLSTKTQRAVIYYTMNGSEPVRNPDGTPGNHTYIYNVSQGVTVPPQQGEFSFSITAIGYANGYALSDIARFIYRYPDAVAQPYATPGSGAVVENTTIQLSTSTEGAIIYYEMANGRKKVKKPTIESKVFDPEAPIIITQKTTIRAIAVKDGKESLVSEFKYTVSQKLSRPEASHPSGTVIANGTTLYLTADSEAEIFYTLDGSNPKGNDGAIIGTSLVLEGEAGSIITVRAYAKRDGYSDSETATFNYTFSYYSNGIFADKENDSVIKNGETIRLSTDVTDGSIFFTTDGSVPTVMSQSGNEVVITGAPGSKVTVKAIVAIPIQEQLRSITNENQIPDEDQIPVVSLSKQIIASGSFNYTIMNKLAPPESTVPSNSLFIAEGQVVLNAAAGTIHYTTDGSSPSAESAVYGEAITVNRDITIKAIAVLEESEASDIATFTYTYAKQVEMPEVSPENGAALRQNSEVTITCKTKGATIYYTTDGTDPNLDDKENINTYVEPIKVDAAITLKIIAAAPGMRESDVLTVGYTVREPVHTEEKAVTKPDQVPNLSNRLMSRKQFTGAGSGPTYQDIVIKNATYGVVVSSDFDVIPGTSKLNVTRTKASSAGQSLVKQSLGQSYGFVATYEISLEDAGDEVQPKGNIELGIPIDPEYENAVIHVVYVGNDGTIELQKTRRSGGMAYAMINHFSQYSLVAAKVVEEKKGLNPLIFVAAAVILIVMVLIIITVVQRRKYYDR
jgi:hypothetical protein